MRAKKSRSALAIVAVTTSFVFAACAQTGEEVRPLPTSDAASVPSEGDGASLDTGAPDGPSDVETTEATLDDAGDAEGSDDDAAVGDAGEGDAGEDLGARCFSCPPGKKNCGDRCVSVSDPAFGCGTFTCESCYTSRFLNASATCSAGQCAIDACLPGTDDCDKDPKNGCEARLDAASTCGSCSTSCVGTATPICSPTGCTAACAAPTTLCESTSCRALSTSTLACGACGAASCGSPNAASATCAAGTCTVTCATGQHPCNGKCYPDDDPNHCGNACGVCASFGAGNLQKCVAGACASACAPGFTDCGGFDGCRVLEKETASCGACGNRCASGLTCVGGTCVAMTTTRPLTGLGSPGDILVDANRIYWTDASDDSVWSADKTTFVKSQIASNQNKPYRLASDGTNLYWSSNLGAAIVMAPLGGGPVTTLYSANQPTGIAVDDSYVYWAEASTARVMKAPKVPGTSTQLVGSHYADSFAIDGTHLYAEAIEKRSFDSLLAAVRIDKTSGAVESYAQLGAFANQTGGIARTDSFVFSIGYTNQQQTIEQFALVPQQQKTLDKWVGAGGPQIAAIAADDCSVYFTGAALLGIDLVQSKGVFRHYVSGESVMPVTTAVVDPRRIAIDDTYVYWTDSGFIGRVPK